MSAPDCRKVKLSSTSEEDIEFRIGGGSRDSISLPQRGIRISTGQTMFNHQGFCIDDSALRALQFIDEKCGGMGDESDTERSAELAGLLRAHFGHQLTIVLRRELPVNENRIGECDLDPASSTLFENIREDEINCDSDEICWYEGDLWTSDTEDTNNTNSQAA
jgi:hypothetical protein